jgi:uncharacterized protein (DUF2342 family)
LTILSAILTGTVQALLSVYSILELAVRTRLAALPVTHTLLTSTIYCLLPGTEAAAIIYPNTSSSARSRLRTRSALHIYICVTALGIHGNINIT